MYSIINGVGVVVRSRKMTDQIDFMNQINIYFLGDIQKRNAISIQHIHMGNVY